MIFLAIVSLLEVIVGAIAIVATSNIIQEIAGLVTFGFGILTMAVLHGIQTFKTLLKEREKKSAETISSN